MVEAELETVAGTRLDELIDLRTVRHAIEQLRITTVDVDVVAEMSVAGRQRLSSILKRQPGSLGHLLGGDATRRLEGFFAARRELPPYVDEIVTAIVEQKFVEQLLTDVIFTAIAAFYRKVNPLFGGMATRMLEDQIKGFIRLFMPTLQQQVVDFATSHDNQRALLELVSAVMQQLFKEPLATFGKVLAGVDPEQSRAVSRELAGSRSLFELGQHIALEVAADFFDRYGAKRVRDLVDLEGHAVWLAEQLDDLFVTLLERPAVAAFVTAELATLVGSTPPDEPERPARGPGRKKAG